MVDPVFRDTNSSALNSGDGTFRFDGQASTVAEVEAFSTSYAVGSTILCTGDDAAGKVSLWVLARDSSDDSKYWKQVI